MTVLRLGAGLWPVPGPLSPISDEWTPHHPAACPMAPVAGLQTFPASPTIEPIAAKRQPERRCAARRVAHGPRQRRPSAEPRIARLAGSEAATAHPFGHTKPVGASSGSPPPGPSKMTLARGSSSDDKLFLKFMFKKEAPDPAALIALGSLNSAS